MNTRNNGGEEIELGGLEDDMVEAIDQAIEADPGMPQSQPPQRPPEGGKTGSDLAVQQGQPSTADDNRDILYKGTSNVIATLEGRRDNLADILRAELNARMKRNQEDLSNVETEKAKALEVVKINSEQALAIRQAMDKDTADTNQKITEETEKFNQMISGQRAVLEHLR